MKWWPVQHVLPRSAILAVMRSVNAAGCSRVEPRSSGGTREAEGEVSLAEMTCALIAMVWGEGELVPLPLLLLGVSCCWLCTSAGTLRVSKLGPTATVGLVGGPGESCILTPPIAC